MEHYFNRMQPILMNQNNIVTVNDVFNRFIDKVRGEIEALSQRESGWVMEKNLEVFINVAQYQPLRGEATCPCPKSCKPRKQ